MTATLWQSKRVWLIQLVLNAFVLAAFWLWLMIPEAHVWHLALSLAMAVLIVWAELWLQCATLAYFGGAEEVRAAFRQTLRRLPAFAIWVVVAGVILWLISEASDYSYQLGGWLHHGAPGFVRTRFSPRQFDSAVEWILWFFTWIFLPLVWLPCAAIIASSGFGGLRPSRLIKGLKQIASVRWWISYLVLLVIGGYLPYRLMRWAPHQGSVRRQIWNMGARFVAAYLLAITAWWVLAAILGHHKPPDEDELVGVREPVGVVPPERNLRATAEPEA